jgi:hypothetical protein
VSETVPAGWDFTSLSCSASGGSTYSIKDRTATINLAAGEAVSCTYTNTKRGHLIVQKTTVPGSDPTVFSITASGSGAITGGGVGTVTDALDKDYEVTPGTYSVAEAVPAGWTKTGDTCQNVAVGAGETKTCTITNTKKATLVISKDAVGGSDTFNFTASGDGLPSSFAITGSGSRTFTNLMPGGFRTVEEGALPSHWDFTSLSCQITVLGDGTSSANTSGQAATSINLGAGDTLTCTYTNTERGRIRIIKGAVGGDGTTTFDFSSTGGLPSPADSGGNFTLTPPTAGTASVTFSDLKPGNYTVTETGPFGTGETDWKLASAVCSATGTGSSGNQDGTNPTANINVGPDGSVTCTFTNVRGSNPVTDTSFCPLPNNQFRLIYLQDTATTYRLNASNPGQFYDNSIYKGTPGGTVTLAIREPYPFVTQGAVPIQVHSSLTLTESGCLVPMGDLTSEFSILVNVENPSLSPSGNPVIVLGDYDPQNMGSSVEIIVTGKVPETGPVYVTTHLDYGLKQTGGWTKGTKNQAIKSPVTIWDPQGYSFSYTITDGGSATLTETVESKNTFKTNPGFAGRVTDSSGLNPVSGVTVEIYDSIGKLGSVVTDDNGEYLFTYKYTRKAALFTVKLPDYGLQQTVTLKSNSFAVVNFELP